MQDICYYYLFKSSNEWNKISLPPVHNSLCVFEILNLCFVSFLCHWWYLLATLFITSSWTERKYLFSFFYANKKTKRSFNGLSWLKSKPSSASTDFLVSLLLRSISFLNAAFFSDKLNIFWKEHKIYTHSLPFYAPTI